MSLGIEQALLIGGLVQQNDESIHRLGMSVELAPIPRGVRVVDLSVERGAFVPPIPTSSSMPPSVAAADPRPSACIRRRPALR